MRHEKKRPERDTGRARSDQREDGARYWMFARISPGLQAVVWRLVYAWFPCRSAVTNSAKVAGAPCAADVVRRGPDLGERRVEGHGDRKHDRPGDGRGPGVDVGHEVAARTDRSSSRVSVMLELSAATTMVAVPVALTPASAQTGTSAALSIVRL